MKGVAIKPWFKVPRLAGMYALIALGAAFAFFLVHEVVGLIRYLIDNDGPHFFLYQIDSSPVLLGTILGCVLVAILVYYSNRQLAWSTSFELSLQSHLLSLLERLAAHYSMERHLDRLKAEIEAEQLKAMQITIMNLAHALELNEKVADPALREEFLRSLYAAVGKVEQEEGPRINLLKLGNWIERVLPVLERRSAKS